jgi:hypothetical protein
MAEKQRAQGLAAKPSGRQYSSSVYLGEEHRWAYWGERPDVGSGLPPYGKVADGHRAYRYEPEAGVQGNNGHILDDEHPGHISAAIAR